MNDVKKYIYLTVVIFLVGVLAWIGFVSVSACGFSATCPEGALKAERTSIPTLIPATIPAANLNASTSAEDAVSEGNGKAVRPSNPGVAGPAVELTGNADAGMAVFEEHCAVCHVLDGVGGHPNPGSKAGIIPSLNPINETLKDPNYKTFAINIDLFIEHGSTPEGNSPIFQMPAWRDNDLLTPQQIADVIAYIIGLNP